VKNVVVLVLAGALLCAPAASAASAGHSANPRLDLLPLPQRTLGAEGASLALQWQDSGLVPNDDAASSANGNVVPKQLKTLGRVLGYALDYGDPFTGGAGVNEIKTAVEKYKTVADATRGFAFWRKDGAKASPKAEGAFTSTLARLRPRRVGQATFSYLSTEHASSLSPIYYLDERAREGRYLIEVRIGAGGESAAKQLAPRLARALDSRVRRAIAGHLQGPPVKIPLAPASGPPPAGPDLSKLVVQPADVGQTQVQNLEQGYGSAPYAISDYGMFLGPAGPYDLLDQNLAWYPTATEAAQVAAYSGFFGGGFQVVSTGPLTFVDTPVDVASAGNNATAEIVDVDSSGTPVFVFGLVRLRKEQLVDSVTLLAGEAAVGPTGLQSVAKAMATRLDAGFPASRALYAPTTWTSQRRSRSRSSSMKRTRCQVPSCNSPSRTGTDSPAVPSSIAMQCEWPLPWSMSSGQMFSVRRSQSSCA
jgi:hypothetical protein